MTKTRTKPSPAPALPLSYLIALAEAGFVVHSYRDVAETVDDGAGETRREWLPRLCIAPGSQPKSFRVIEWRTAPENGYASDGYFPSDGHTHGGHNRSILSALAWFKWLEKQRCS